ncbi:MAG: site-specific DNA-methyltransferase [Deltaproteobacteria bacterium]|nr:site-specific DNA-methyltransferase [Deltaproteobacteria bacterium]
MDGESLDTKQDRLQRLKEIFPELFAESQLDWEKLKAAFGDDINFANERYVLNWAGKSDAFKVLQQPTTATLKPIPEESINFDTTQNLFIEGENLEVLKILQKAYYGKVKCIIIDPPYNTGSDSFIYPDRFSEKKEDYLKRIGDKDEEGFLMKEGLFRKNSKDSGHYHSNWLSMMYPRLFLAKNLLRDDGVIFVHIDDNEVHNLRLVMNEIFGEENLRNVFAVRRYDKNLNRQFIESGLQTFNVGFEYVLCYSKGSEFSFNPILKESDEERQNFGYWKGFWNDADRPTMRFDILGFAPEGGQWKWNEERSLKAVDNYKTFIKEFSKEMTLEEYWEKTGKELEFIRRNPEGKGKNKGVENWIPPSKGKLRNTNWTDLFASKNTNEAEGLFDFPKNPEVIKNFLIGATDEEDIILDFFAGSGTTAQAVLELNKKDGGNRKFILVQMPELCDENSEAFKAGYKTIADIGKERIRRVIKKTEKEKKEKPDLFADGKLDLGFKVFRLSPSSFKIWRSQEITEENLEQQLDAFTNPARPGAEKTNMLYELMLKAGYELTSPIRYVIASKAKQSPKGKKIASGSANPRNDGIGFYSINNNELIIALDAMNEKLVEQIIAAKPQKVITLDSLFTGNDQLKTNTVLQMRDAGVDFKTI